MLELLMLELVPRLGLGLGEFPPSEGMSHVRRSGRAAADSRSPIWSSGWAELFHRHPPIPVDAGVARSDIPVAAAPRGPPSPALAPHSRKGALPAGERGRPTA